MLARWPCAAHFLTCSKSDMPSFAITTTVTYFGHTPERLCITSGAISNVLNAIGTNNVGFCALAMPPGLKTPVYYSCSTAYD